MLTSLMVLQDSAPRKRRRKESHVNPGTLLTWLQKQVESYDLAVTDMTSSFQNGLAISAIIHRYRPDLLDFSQLDPADICLNNQLAFDILECELGVPPITTGQEMAASAEAGKPPDKLAMTSYLTLVYEIFRKEIPYTHQQEVTVDDLDDSVYYHNHKEGKEKKAKRKEREKGQSIGQLVASEVSQRKKRKSLEKETEEEVGQADQENRYSRVSNKKRLAKLMERAALQERKRKEMAEPKNIKNEERYKIIEQQFLGGGSSNSKPKAESSASKQPGDLKRAIGRLDSTDWNVKQIEEKLKEKDSSRRTDSNTEKVPKWSKEAFNDKLAKVRSNLYSVEDDKKQKDIDASLAKLQAKLREGSQDGSSSSKVSSLVGELSNKFNPSGQERPELKRDRESTVWAPPKLLPGHGKSDNCFFCGKKVYVVERMSAEGKFFHRACFRCDYCNILLRLGSYVYHREGRFAGKFFCIPHSTEKALEKYKYRSKLEEIQANELKKKDLAKRREEKDRLAAISPSNRGRLREQQDLIARGATPERAEYEASIDLSAEESGLEQIDEDEWTDRNFGNSTANDMNTSEDSVSDLESDDGDGQGGDGVGDIERPLTADETRRLHRVWRNRYKGRTGLGVF